MKDVIKQGDWNDYVIRAGGPRVQLSIRQTGDTVDYIRNGLQQLLLTAE